MKSGSIYFNKLSKIAQLKALQLSNQEPDWIANLDQVVQELAEKWKLTLKKVLHGGNGSLIIDVVKENKEPAVLKIGLPGSSIHSEALVLMVAKGCGYVQLYEVDHTREALLLAKEGIPLSHTFRSIDEHIAIICSVLEKAWIKPIHNLALPNSIQVALQMKIIIEEKWRKLNQPFSWQTFNLAMEFIQFRISSFNPNECVLIHGDAHGYNILESKNGNYILIDPDGMIGDKGLDLMCIMRDWSEELLNGNTFELLLARCLKLVNLTGADKTSVWQWGFLGRLMIGLTLLEYGQLAEGKMTLEVADRISHYKHL